MKSERRFSHMKIRKVKAFTALWLVVLLTTTLFPATAFGHSHMLDIPRPLGPEEVALLESILGPDDFILGEIYVTEPRPIEEFWTSEHVIDLSPEELEELKERMGYFDEITPVPLDYAELPLITDVYFTPDYEGAEPIRIEFIPASEYVPIEYLPEQLQEDISAYVELGIIPANAVADIAVSNLRTLGREPLTLNGEYLFDFFIVNQGTLNAAAVRVRVYIDNQVAGVMDLGTIPARAGGTIEFRFRLGGNVGGNRTMMLSSSTTSPETNFMNNMVSRMFRWQVVQGFVDLRVENIRNLTSGNAPFVATNPQTFSFFVHNRGTISSLSASAELSIETLILDEHYIGTMPASSWIELRITLNLLRSGNPRFRVNARDRNGNTGFAQATFTVLPDGCGIWSRRLTGDTRNITIQVDHPNILPVDFVRNVANEWNNISSNIHISQVAANISGTPTANIWDRNLSDPDAGGSFSPNRAGNFTGGEIVISMRHWNSTTPDNPWRRGIILHEIGHLLGLNHPHDTSATSDGNPLCLDFAVMRYRPLSTNYVTDHDRAALRRQHGN